METHGETTVVRWNTQACLFGLALVLGNLLPWAFYNSANASSTGYRLLELDGHRVKWGNPGLGKGATVSYAFAERPLKSDGAQNCSDLLPMRALVGEGLTMETLSRETAEAFRVWERAAGLLFEEAENPEEADIILGVQAQPRGRAFANVSYKPQPERQVGTIERALLCLNPDHRWKVGFDGNETVYDIRYTLIHEIGHAIGLDHPGRSGQVMAFRYSEAYDDLQPGDLLGVKQLYGPPLEDPLQAQTIHSREPGNRTFPSHAKPPSAALMANVVKGLEPLFILEPIIQHVGSIAAIADRFGRFLGMGEKAGAPEGLSRPGITNHSHESRATHKKTAASCSGGNVLNQQWESNHWSFDGILRGILQACIRQID